MKFLSESQNWSRGISAVQNAVGSPISNPIVENIFLSCKDGKAVFIATNLNLTIRCEIEVEITEPGEIVLPTKIISGIIRDIPEGKVDFSVSGKVVNIVCGEFKAKVNGHDPKEFPPYVPVEGGFEFEIEVLTLKDIIRKTVIATTQEKTRYELDGVCFDFKNGEMNCVSTDGRRLTLYKFKNEKLNDISQSILVPTKTLLEVVGSLPDDGNVVIQIQDKKAQFHCGDVTIISNLLNYNFPQYDRIVPVDGRFKAYVKRDLLMAAVRRASNLTSADTGMIILSLEQNSIGVLAEKAEVGGEGRDRIDAEYSGERMETRYNFKYVLDFIKVINEDEIEIELWESTKSAVMRGKENSSYLYVIMPMKPPERLNEGN